MNDPLQHALEELVKDVIPNTPSQADQSVSAMLMKVAGVVESNPSQEVINEIPRLLKEAAAVITDLKTKIASGTKDKVIDSIVTRLQTFGQMNEKQASAQRETLKDLSMEKLAGMAMGLDSTGVPDPKMFEVTSDGGPSPQNTEESATMKLSAGLNAIASDTAF